MNNSALVELCNFAAADSKKKAYVVAVPGIATRDPRDWNPGRSRSPWLESVARDLASQGRGCNVLAFRHRLNASELSSWSQVKECGRDFLSALDQYRKANQIVNNPIVLVGHSLGGFIIKYALVCARRSWNEESVLSVLQGLVFICSPHLHFEQRGEWQKVPGILLTGTKPNNQLFNDAELRDLFDICNQFKDTQLQVPILSAFESKPSKLRKPISLNSHSTSRCSLVDKNAAKTGVGDEELIEIDATHQEACLVEEVSKRQRLLEFIQKCINSIQQEESSRSRSGTFSKHDSKIVFTDSYASSPTFTTSSEDSSEKDSESQKSPLSRNNPQSKSMPDMTFIAISDKKRADPKLPCFSIEHGVVVDDFVGRDDILKKIDEALEGAKAGDDPSRVRYVALHGIGGIGKTSTAAQYWTTRGPKYDARFWIRADNPEKITDGFGRIAVSLGLLDSAQAQDRAFNLKVAMDWLENPVRTFDDFYGENRDLARWLIVFDNVDDIDSLNLEDFWPVCGGGSIIVTSRNPTTAWRPKDVEPRNEGIRMDPLSEEEAAKFLRRIAPAAEKRRDPNAAIDLARRLDCIPIALRRMGDVVHRKQMTFRRFLDAYQAEANLGKDTLQKMRIKRQNANYDFTLSTVWFVEKLPEQTLSLINVLAFLDPDSINEDLLIPGDTRLKDPLYPRDIADYEDAKSELSFSSLINDKSHEDLPDDEISLHRTVQDAVRAKMTPEQFHTTFETTVQLLLGQWPVKGPIWHYTVDHWPQCEAVSTHLIKLHLHYENNCAKSGCPFPSSSFARLLIYGGWYWYQRGAPDQARKFFDTAELLASKLPDGDSLLEDVWMCQGCLATETNDGLLCWHYYEKLLENTLKRTPKPTTVEEHEKVATAYNEMGIGHMMWGQIDEGQEHFEKARSLLEPRKKDSDTILSVFMFATANLGLVHWLQERYDLALLDLTETYQLYKNRKLVGEGDSFIPGRLMHAIGNVKVSQGKLEEGLSWHQEALQHYLSTIGKGHHRAADLYHKLADDYIRLEKYNEASKCIERALIVFDSKRCYRPEKMRTTHLLGQLCEAEGRLDEAREHFDRASDMYKAVRRERKEEIPSKELRMSDFNDSVTFWSR